jgi:hypothetical protein
VAARGDRDLIVRARPDSRIVGHKQGAKGFPWASHDPGPELVAQPPEGLAIGGGHVPALRPTLVCLAVAQGRLGPISETTISGP